MMNNKYGICEWFLPLEGPSAIRMAGQMGYDGIQIHDLGGPANNWPLADRRIQQMYIDVQQEYGIKIQSLNPVGAMMNHGGVRYPMNSIKGVELIDNFRKTVDICKEMNIDTILFPGCDNSQFRNDYEEKLTCDYLELFSDEAASYGISFVYESFGTTEKTLRILERAGDSLKLCYDILNPIRRGFADPLEEIRIIDLSKIDCIHVKDAFEHMNGTCLLGTGAAKVEDTISALKSEGYQGWYVTENFYYLPPMSEQGNGWDMAEKDLKFMKEKCKQFAE